MRRMAELTLAEVFFRCSHLHVNHEGGVDAIGDGRDDKSVEENAGDGVKFGDEHGKNMMI